MLNFKYIAILVSLSINFAQYRHGKATKKELQAEQQQVIKNDCSGESLNEIIAKKDASIKQLMLDNESLNKHFASQRNELRRAKQNDKTLSEWAATSLPDSIKRMYERPEKTGAKTYRQ